MNFFFIMRKKIVWILLIIFLFNFMPMAGQAAIRQSEDFVFIGPEEVIDDNLLIIAENAEILGDINGDLILAVASANIKGRVAGDILGVVTGDINISGPVEGDVRVLCVNLSVENKIGGNLSVVCAQLKISSDAEIGHSLLAAVGTADVSGRVVKNINLLAGNVSLNAPVGENVFVQLDRDGQLTLLSETRIGGNINYIAAQELNRAPGAEVAGVVKKIDVIKKDYKEEASLVWLVFRLIALLSMFLVAFLFINLFSGFCRSISSTMLAKPGKLLLLGFAEFFLIPIAVFILILTIIGIPLALIIMVLYLTALYLAKVFAGLALGNLFLEKVNPGKTNLILAAIGGILFIAIVISIPVIGWIFKLLIVWWGLAGIINWGYSQYKNKQI